MLEIGQKLSRKQQTLWQRAAAVYLALEDADVHCLPGPLQDALHDFGEKDLGIGKGETWVVAESYVGLSESLVPGELIGSGMQLNELIAYFSIDKPSIAKYLIDLYKGLYRDGDMCYRWVRLEQCQNECCTLD